MSCAPVSYMSPTRSSVSSGSTLRTTTESSCSACVTVRDFAPYHRCCVTWSMRAALSISLLLLARPQLEPIEPARRVREEVRKLADRRKRRLPEHLHRHHPVVLGQVELHCLCRAREVVDADEHVVLPGADVSEDARVVAAQ